MFLGVLTRSEILTTDSVCKITMENVAGNQQTTGDGRGSRKKRRAKQKEKREEEMRKGEETKEKEKERQQKMDDLEWKILTVAIHEIINDSILNIEIIEEKENCLKLINHTPEEDNRALN